MKKVFFLSLLLTQLAACSPEIGSEGWCNNLNETPKGEWTGNEVKDYAKHCLFK